MFAAIFTGPRAVEAREVECLPPGRGEVLVEVARAGICGSDLHVYLGRWQPPEKAPGHELSGRVAAIGAGVTGWRVGDRVTSEAFGHCGRCRWCRRGLYNHCERMVWRTSGHGAMSQFATLPASALCAIDGLSDEQGALVEPLAVGIRAASRLGKLTGRAVAVIGAGTIGLTSALAAAGLGADVVLFARYAHQADAARQVGIEHVRLGRTGGCERFELIVDSVATGESLTQAIELIEPFGRIVGVGAMTAAAELDLNPLLGKEAELTGSNTYCETRGKRDVQRAIDWLRAGVVDPTPMITHRFGLQDVAEAFRVAADKATGSVKVMLLPNG